MRASNQRNSILGTNTEIFGTLSIDTTDIITPSPISITHSNAFSNSAPYGSGSIFISSTAETNNQPLQINAKNTNSSTLGNAVNLVLENYGGTKTASSAYDVDIEFVANNELVNAYNGKTELRQSSGRDTGDDRLRDGYFQISPRRGPLHPSGENTGFESIFWFLPATSKGLGMFETKGNGIVIDPTYNYSSPSKLTLINTFQDTELINRATASGKYSILENDGDTDSYIRSRSQNGDASILIQAERGNKNSTLNLRSNWTSGTTGGCFINLLTNVDDTGYRFGVDASGNFYIRRLLAGVVSNVVNISAASSGLVQFINTSNTLTGRIRLGAGTGGIINYNSSIGIYVFDNSIDCKNIRPTTTETFDLGSASFEWRDIYSQNVLTVSDFNKKKEIQPLLLGTSFLMEVKPVSYRYRSNDDIGLGVIAQDLLAVCEKYGAESMVRHNNGKDYSVRYNEFIPILINAIKELTVRIEKLEA
jgi:hypothetical protein